jgi:hypothetical protein
MIRRRAIFTAALALLPIAFVACGGSAPRQVVLVVPEDVTGWRSPVLVGSGSTTGLPLCRGDQLSGYDMGVSHAAGGVTYRNIGVTNRSDEPCVLQGTPYAAFLDAEGQVLPITARRGGCWQGLSCAPPPGITVQPGRNARFSLTYTNIDAGTGKCDGPQDRVHTIRASLNRDEQFFDVLPQLPATEATIRPRPWAPCRNKVSVSPFFLSGGPFSVTSQPGFEFGLFMGQAASPGQTVKYLVILKHSAKRIYFDNPCPAFTIDLVALRQPSGDSTVYSETHPLECDPYSALDRREERRWYARFQFPEDLPPGHYSVRWYLGDQWDPRTGATDSVLIQ